MIDLFAFATNGFGFMPNAFTIATNGFTFEVIIPGGNTGGGGTTAGNVSAFAYPYYVGKKIVVRIKLGDHEWEEILDEPPLTLDPQEAIVIAAFRNLKSTSASATFLRSLINTDTVIKVRKL